MFRYLTSLKVDALELDFFHYPKLLEEAARRNFDQTIGLGVTDAQSPRVETVEEISSLIVRGRKGLGESRIGWVHPHCGQRSLHRETAFEKNANLTIARDDTYSGEAAEARGGRQGRDKNDSNGYFLVNVKRETGEIVVTFHTSRHKVVRRFKSKYAERLLQAINDDANSLGIGRRRLAYLILELGRAEASLKPPSIAYRQKLTG